MKRKRGEDNNNNNNKDEPLLKRRKTGEWVEVEEFSPNTPDWFVQQIFKCFRENRWMDGFNLFFQAQGKFPNFKDEGYFNKVLKHLESNDLTFSFDRNIACGIFYFFTNSHEKAILCFKKVVESLKNKERNEIENNNLAVTSFFLGRICLKFKKYKKAKKGFLKAVELEPKNASFWNYLGVCYLRLKKDYKEAKKCFVTAVKLEPKNASSWNCFAKYYVAIRKYKKAKECFLKAVELEPKNAIYNKNFGYLCHLLGGDMLAIKHFTIASKNYPDLDRTLISENLRNNCYEKWLHEGVYEFGRDVTEVHRIPNLQQQGIQF